MPKYFITAPRFIDGVYHRASPELPAIIELPEIDPKTGKAYKIDKGLIPVEKGAPVKPLSHFAPSLNSGALHPHSTPLPVAKAPEAAPVADAKRASDKKVI